MQNFLNIQWSKVSGLRALIWALMIVTGPNIQAQVNQGIITYKHTLFNEENSGFMPLPPSFELTTQLHYNAKESLYERNSETEVDIDPNDRRARWIRRMMTQRIKTFYKNTEDNVLVEAQNMFGKDFLINENLPERKWKISAGEQKDIMGYLCMKALYKDSTENIVVYFTPQITLPHGPDQYGGLPGLILEVQSAEFHILAQSIIQDEPQIKKPKNGEKISREALNKLREEKIKERQEMWGDRGRGRG